MSNRTHCRNQCTVILELVEDRIENKPHAARFFWYIASMIYLPFYETKIQGTPPYNRPTLVALILYGLYKGCFSSESILELAKENLGAIWIIGNMTLPSSKTIDRVINDLLENIELFFDQVLKLCFALNLVGGEKAYIDGTKTKANASKHKAMSYENMSEKLETYNKDISDLIQEIFVDIEVIENLTDKELKELIYTESKQIYEDAKAKHRQELEEINQDIFSDKEPEQNTNNNQQDLTILDLVEKNKQEETKKTMDSIGFKAMRAEKIAEAKTELEETWKEENGNKPIPKDTQINFTDSESKIMVTKHHGVQQCYNNFALVDDKAHIILGTYTTNSPGDSEAFIPTIEDAKINLDSVAGLTIGADAGFYSATNIEYAIEQGLDYYFSIPEPQSPYAKDKFVFDKEKNQYTCPEGQELTPGAKAPKNSKTTTYKTDACKNCPVQSDCTKATDGIRKIIRNHKDDTLREEAKNKAISDIGREILRTRKSVAEPIWGNMKQRDGLIQLHYRGLCKSSREFKLRCTMHNLRKMCKAFCNNQKVRDKIRILGTDPSVA